MTIQLSRRNLLTLTASGLVLTACGGPPESGAETSPGASNAPPAKAPAAGPLSLSAIPDQDPEDLNRLYPLVAERFSTAIGSPVKYQPVTDYTAVVRAFEVGDVYFAWMGGLTGVQARSRVPNARAVVQRDIDQEFHSLFIAHRSSGLKPFTETAGLSSLAGHTLTFGSETSTSGRLMPQSFMDEAGLEFADLQGKPGFSGSHDATIAAVASGSFEVGAVNEQVWNSTVEEKEVDLTDVEVLWRTPGYADYHWLARPDIDDTFGAGTQQKMVDLLLSLDAADPDDAKILDLFGAEKFIPTTNDAYDKIEEVATKQGLLA